MLCSLLVSSYAQIVRSAIDPNFPPFSSIDSDGQPAGFSVELFRAALAAMGQDASLRLDTWPQIKKDLEAGSIDASPFIARTPERERLFDFSVPYLTMDEALFVRDDNPRIRSLADLEGERIAVMAGACDYEYVRRARVSDRIISVPCYEDAFKLLVAGDADAVVALKEMGVSTLKNLGLTNIQTVGMPREEFHQDICFAVTKGNAELLALLNEGLAKVKADGTYRQLASQWLGQNGREAAKSRVIVYGGDEAYPPYEFLDEKGRPCGFNIDLVRAIARELGLDVSFQLGPWSETRARIEQGEVDLGSMAYSAERDRVLNFSTPHSKLSMTVFARSDSPPYERVGDLKGRRVAVQRGGLMHDYAVDHGLEAQLQFADGAEGALALLASGKADFALGQCLQGYYWIHKNGWKNIEAAKTSLVDVEYCFAVSKENKDLLFLFNDGLRRIKQSGEYREIYDHWLGVLDPDFSRQMKIRFVLSALGVLVLLGFMTMVIFFGLKRQVRLRTAQLQQSNAALQASREHAMDMMAEAVGAKESLELAQYTVDNATCGIFWIRSDSSFTYVNAAACDMIGYTKAELLQRSVLDIDPDFDSVKWAQLWNDLEDVRELRLESHLCTKEGAVFPIEVLATFIEFDERRLVCAFVQDVSERKLAEISLKESEEKYRSLFKDHAAVKILQDAETGQIVDANPSAVEFYGWSLEELLSMNMSQICLLTQEDLEENRKAAAEKRINRFEVRHRLADGSIRDVAVFLGMITSGEQTLIHSIIYDITESKKSERERRRLAQAIEQSPEAVIITDLAGIIQYVNPAFTVISGYSREESLGKTPVFLKSGKHDKASYDRIWQTLRSGRSWEGHLINKRKNGELYTEEISISPVKDPDGTMVGYVAVNRDITEDLAREEQLRQSQKMEAVGQLAGGVAHDFNNMLQVILGFSQILLDKCDPQTQDYQNIDQIRQAAVRATGLTRQLLTFSHKQPINIMQVNLNEVFQETRVLLKVLLGETVKCVLSPDPSVKSVYADLGQLSQVIMNLAVNARDAMPEGGTMTISTENVQFEPPIVPLVTGARAGSFACLSVRDTGCGMSEHVKAHLFDPFFTTKGVGKGTGLGLSVVYGIVKQLKGWIEVESEEGKGSVFRIYLPDADSMDLADFEPADKKSMELDKILFVCDNLQMQEKARTAIHSFDREIVVAHSVDEALSRFRRSPANFSLLLCNMDLDGGRGVKLADTLRDESPGLSVLLLADSADHEYSALTQELEKKEYSVIQTPFSLMRLLSEVNKLLEDNGE